MSADTTISIYNFTTTDSRDKALYIGKDFRRPFTWGIDYDATLDPPFTSAKDITGFGFQLEVRKKASDAVAVLTFSTTDSSIVLTDATNGVFELVKTDVETASLTDDTYCYDLGYTDLAGEKFILFRGVFEIVEPVTK